MLSHYELHRRVLAKEQELLEKRALYESQVDEAMSAIKSARRDHVAARASRRPALRFGAIRPIHWVMLRLSQS
jgi:hypothetical protein